MLGKEGGGGFSLHALADAWHYGAAEQKGLRFAWGAVGEGDVAQSLQRENERRTRNENDLSQNSRATTHDRSDMAASSVEPAARDDRCSECDHDTRDTRTGGEDEPWVSVPVLPGYNVRST